MEEPRLKLLLVEDNPDDAELLLEDLRAIPNARFEVDHFERLAGAVDALDRNRYDIMLLDLSLPDSHGLNSLESVREKNPDLPIVILTGLDDSSMAFEAVRFGAQDYLVKGKVDMEVLARCIRYGIERSRIQRELREHRDHLHQLVEQQTADLREKSERLQQEIDEHRKTEGSLRRLATAIENSAEAVVVTQPDGSIEYVNPAFERITGYDRAEILGKNPRVLNSGKQPDAFYREFYETLASGRPWRGQFINKKKDGTYYTCDSTISSVYDDGGRVCNYVGISRDVSEEILLREQLNRAQRLESVGQLAGGLAHDFNNILHAILGFATLNMRDIPAGSRMESNNNEICVAANRAAELVRQLLAFSRKQVLTPKPCDLNEVINGLRGMLRRLLREDIDLDFIPGHALGNVEADVSQLEQVLVNLCVNARDAMPSGGRIVIETENVLLNGAYTATHPWARPGRYVLLSVADTGRGMPAVVLDKIFEPFFTTKEEQGGTGLGLATVYGIIKQHNGLIHCYSEEGKGTSFKIYLPMCFRKADSVGHKIESAIRGGNETILVVEDDHAIIALTEAILGRAGYTVIAAADGIQALRLLDTGKPVDIILSDVIMPNLGGLELHERLKQRNAKVPILFASGYSSRAIDPRLFSTPGISIIQKPYAPDELLKKIRALLDAR